MNIVVLVEKLKVAAQQIGAVLELEPEYQYVGMITFQNGKKSLFRASSFNINGVGSVYVAKDKRYASYFLQKLGYSIPKEQSFFSEKLNSNLEIKRDIHDGFAYAAGLGFPVIIKPNDRSQGKMVTKIYSEAEYYKAAELILQSNNVFLVQEFCKGRDYRVVVLGEQVFAAYERIALKIVGDGVHSIRELAEEKQAQINNMGRKATINLDDFRTLQKLERLNLTLESVLPLHKELSLLDNANLSAGGDSVDFTEEIHPDFAKLAINVTRDMGLNLCGLDIMTADITRPMSEQDYKIIEINGSPGLDNFAAIGEKQARIAQNFYIKLLTMMEKM